MLARNLCRTVSAPMTSALVLVLVGVNTGLPAYSADEQLRVPDDVLQERANRMPDLAPRGIVARSAAAGSQAMSWSSLGPAPISNLYNPDGSGPYQSAGRVLSIALDPRSGSVAYIATALGGVWKTTNGGAAWTALTDYLPSLASGSIVLDPANPDEVWYGTGEHNSCIDCEPGDGLFNSHDGGATWYKIAEKSVVGSYISRVALQPGGTGVILVGSDRGVVRSADGGKTWTRVLYSSNSTVHCQDLAFDPTSTSNAYACVSDNGIYKSTNSGATWAPLTAGLPAVGTFTRISMAIAPSNSQVLYASFSDSKGLLLGMYKTTNGGTSWSKLAATPDYLAQGNSGSGQGWYDNAVVVDPTDANVCFAAGCNPQLPVNMVIRTTDGGASWTGVGADVTTTVELHPDFHALAIHPSTGMLWAGCDGGVWTSADRGSHWTNRNSTLSITQFFTVAVDPTNSNIIMGGAQDNGTSIWDGTTWYDASGGDGASVLITATNPPSYYTSFHSLAGLFRTSQPFNFDPNYSNLAQITGPWSNSNDPASWGAAPLAADPLSPNYVYAATNKVYFTDQTGATWNFQTPTLAYTNAGAITSIGLSTGEPYAIYTTSSDGIVYVVTDADTWSYPVNITAGLPNGPLSGLSVSPYDWHVVVLCVDTRPLAYYQQLPPASAGVVFATLDGGTTWFSISGDLPQGISPICLTVDWRPETPVVYLGTTSGVYTCTDGGTHWTKTSAGLPNVAVYSLALDRTGNYLVAATHGRGMWRATIPLSSPVRHRPDDPAAYASSLEQPVVTPSGTMRLSYSLAENASVRWDLVSVTGQLVATQTTGLEPAGKHRATWTPASESGDALPSGVYFLRLHAGDAMLMRRVVITK